MSSDFLTFDEVLDLDLATKRQFHHRHLNPRLSSLLEAIGADKNFVRAQGSHLWDDQGNRYLDLITGCGAINLGHNHPRVIAALEKTAVRPHLVETLDPFQAALAHNLSVVSPGSLQRVYFVNSGAEAVDTAIKLARAATRRAKLVACRGGFHGRTIGALSVTERADYRDQFGPLLSPVEFVPFGDADALESSLRGRDAACFILEPVQGEGGIVVPPRGYLTAARELCTRYGTLLVADEIQTGMGRTGTMFAVEHERVAPDALLLGKSLGAGVIPISAVLTSDRVFRRAHGGTVRTPFHHTTYGGYPRSCVVALATLETLIQEDLPAAAARSGEYVLQRLLELREREPLIADVRGRGLLIGIELAPATTGMLTAFTGGVVNQLSRSFFTGLIMMHLMQEHGIITAFTVNNLNVLRLEPPLTIEREHLDYFLAALEQTLRDLRSFPRAVAHSWRTSIKAVLA